MKFIFSLIHNLFGFSLFLILFTVHIILCLFSYISLFKTMSFEKGFFRWPSLHSGLLFLWVCAGSTSDVFFQGLLLLWLCAWHMNIEAAAKVVYGGLVLVAVGEAGRSASLNQFLESEYLKQQKQPDFANDEKLKSGQEAVWRLPWFLGTIVPLALPYPHWTKVFLISTIVMGIPYLVFLLGFLFLGYLRNKSNPIPLVPELEESRGEERSSFPNRISGGGSRTMIDRINKSNSIPRVLELEKSRGEERSLIPKRARIRGGGIWMLIIKLKEMNFLKEILLILLAFLIFSLVEATGSTFFLEQTDKLYNPLKSLNPDLYLTIVTSLATYLSQVMWSFLFPEQPASPNVNSTLWKIGCGMACSLLACVAALLVEVLRINQVKGKGLEEEVYDDDPTTISMSIFALLPQFFLLGVMKGLAVEGVIELFVKRLANGTETTDEETETLKDYGSHITDFVLGTGKLIMALSILVLSGPWFHDNINRSSLVHYYVALVLLGCANCCYYCYVASRSYAKANSSPSPPPTGLTGAPTPPTYSANPPRNSFRDLENL